MIQYFIILRILLNIFAFSASISLFVMTGSALFFCGPLILLLIIKIITKQILIYKRNRAKIGSKKIKSLNNYINFINHFYYEKT